MATPPIVPKSRGHTLFDQQAQLHVHNAYKSASHPSTGIFFWVLLPQMKLVYSMFLASASTPVAMHSSPTPPSTLLHHHMCSSPLVHPRSPFSVPECVLQSNNDTVQLISIQSRPDPTDSAKDSISNAITPSETSKRLLETDFPLVESTFIHESQSSVNNVMPSNSLCCAVIEQAFDYLRADDDDDGVDNVIHQGNSPQNPNDLLYSPNGYENEEISDGNDSVDTIDLDATASTNHQNDSKPYHVFFFIIIVCHFNLISYALIYSPI